MTCNEEHFMTVEGECKAKSATTGCEGEISSAVGCVACVDGFYLHDRECARCDAAFENCVTCTETRCERCGEEFVFRDGHCVPYRAIDNCVEAADSSCSRCTFWHRPSPDGSACESHAVWWVVLLCVLFALGVAVLLCALVCVAVVQGIALVKRQQRAQTTCVFKMQYSNVVFTKTKAANVVMDKDVVVFGDGAIPIGEEAKALLCVGNRGKKLKIQAISKDGSDKFDIRTQPDVVVLRKGEACEFEVFIKPLCSTVIDDRIVVVVEEGPTTITNIPIGVKAETEMTTILHYDDIACEKQIGEGSFGVVFKGTFRGDVVEVKKMKDVVASEASMDEFVREVGMLDKFRCDQVVHFYGACLIPNDIMTVSEFAPCGSLMDCIRKRPEPEPKIKTKLMLDAAKGLAYLHGNGILHRDIKPDNVLVFSLDDLLTVNWKLTDFGSSRNVNMLMTIMTFTKGVGTPVYMAPEVLNKEKYKKPADVYSFGVMMYECFAWAGAAYPKELFKYPWDIVSFINAGKRLARPSSMRDDVYGLITRCWREDPKDRIGWCFDWTYTQKLETLLTSLR